MPPIFRVTLDLQKHNEGKSLDNDQIAKLKKAVAEARLLIEFAVRMNRRIDNKILDDVMKAIGDLGDLDNAQSVPIEQEGQFWKAYQELTLATYPVTACSIRESEAESAKRWSTTAKHSLIAGIIFAILAFLQVVWVTGTALRKDLREATVAWTKTGETTMALGARQAELYRDRAALPPGALKRAKEIDDELSKITPKLELQYGEMTRVVAEREAILELLAGWYEQVTFNRWPLKADNKVRDIKKNMKFPASGSKPATEQEALDEDVKGYELFGAMSQRLVELDRRVDVILNALQNYVFPVLLGLLGALTYILRSLIVQLREYSYTENFSRLSFVRVALGMMAGLLGGMLIPSDEGGVMKNLSPLALSFLLGYAVEVLFAFLDRIVTAFTAQPAKA